MPKAGRPPRPAPKPGTKAGHLTVIEECRRQGKNGSFERALRVECDCPAKTEKIISFGAFGRTLSCGCTRVTSDNAVTPEGPTHDPESVVPAEEPDDDRPRRVDADGRTCTGRCGEYKPWSEYYLLKSGHAAECIECMSIRRKRPAKFRIDDDGRQCSSGKCGYVYKPWSEFNKGKGARNRNPWCKTCVAEQYQGRTPEAKSKHEELLRKLDLHQMAYETFERLNSEHGGNCWRCKQPEIMMELDGTHRPLTVDWDREHCNFEPNRNKPTCGECVRGLLCTSCVYIIADIHKHGLDSLLSYLNSSRPTEKLETELSYEQYSSGSENMSETVSEISTGSSANTGLEKSQNIQHDLDIASPAKSGGEETENKTNDLAEVPDWLSAMRSRFE